MALPKFKVTVAIHDLFCFHGEDVSGDSEPYVWVTIFKIDGETIRQSGNQLAGAPFFFFSPGSQGNIGSGISTGQNKRIPHEVGRLDTTLEPIIISQFGQGPDIEVPGIIGFFCTLMEENLSPNDAMESGHAALNDLLTTMFSDFVSDIRLDEAAVGIKDLMRQKGLSLEQAVEAFFSDRFQPIQKTLTKVGASVVEAAVLNALDLFGGLDSAIDRDDFMGRGLHVVSQTDLLSKANSKIEFTDFMVDNKEIPEAGKWTYNLHSTIFAHIHFEVFPDEIIPMGNRVEVSCVHRGHSRFVGTWIQRLGGMENGNFWRLFRDTVVDLISKGEKSFFVRASDGSETEIEVVDRTPTVDHPFLRTRANNRPEDNLLNLPECPIGKDVIE